MRIESIRLHPFAGTRDRTITFVAGTNLLEGPNEAGKSTLCSALFHTLFTPTDLTPAKFKKTMGLFLPRPNGDHARVTLTFTSGGVRHTLRRTWGAGADTTLIREGLPDLADPRKAQEIISQALRWNEATWEQVLFINQAKLNDTLQLADGSGTDDVAEILRSSGSIDGDIAPERLIEALEVRIAELYSNWDRQFQRPRDGRSISNPHKRNVGPVLKAFYALEELQHQYDAVVQHEQAIDAVNARIKAAREILEKDRAFVEDGRDRKGGLHRRSLLEQSLKHGQDTIARLMKVMQAWPGAEQVLKEKKEAIERCEKEIEKLKAELANAKLHEGGDKVRSGFQAIVEAKKAVEEARKELAAITPVTKEQVDELRKLGQRIERIEVEIKAQKLAAVLRSKVPLEVQVKRGGSDAETIGLSPGKEFSCAAEGRISIDAGDLSIEVRSDQKDVEQLYTDLLAARETHEKALAGLEVPDLATLIARQENSDRARQKLANAGATFTACLQKKTEEQWQKAIDDLKNIPPSRSVIELENEQRRILADQARFDQERKNLEKDLAEWTKAYSSIDQLMLKVVDLRTLIGKEEAELATLPDVPAGFEDAAGYLKKLEQTEVSFDRTSATLHELEKEQSHLQGRTPERTTEELKEELDLKQRQFKHELDQAKAYERILAKVRSLSDREGPDPFAGFNARVEHFVQILTNGRYKAQLEGVRPAGLIGEHPLENAILSQGTKGCFALAIRLAYAEVYLGDNEGFVIMDDPLTDMDPDRRRCAVNAINDFAQKYQVIVLTCHPEHSRLFEKEGVKMQQLGSAKAVA